MSTSKISPREVCISAACMLAMFTCVSGAMSSIFLYLASRTLFSPWALLYVVFFCGGVGYALALGFMYFYLHLIPRRSEPIWT